MNAAVDFGNFDGDVNDYGLPEAGHVETMMDGLIDSVEGNESYNLTKAQIYLYSVLDSNDVLTRQQRRDGNESFFGSIGKGLKAVWDFIIRMFNAVGKFFFGGTETWGGGGIKKTEDEIAKAKKLSDDIDAFNRKQKTDADVKHVAHAALQMVKEEKATPTSEVNTSDVDNLEQVANEILAELKEGKKVDQKRVIEQMMVIMPKLNGRTRQHLTERLKRIEDSTIALHHMGEGKDWEDFFDGTSYKTMYEGFIGQLGHAPGLSLGGFIPLKDKHHADQLLTILQRYINDDVKKIMKVVSSHKADMVKMIKELQAKIETHGKNPDTSQSFSNDLKVCKRFMTLTTDMAKAIEAITADMAAVAKDVGRLIAPVAH